MELVSGLISAFVIALVYAICSAPLVTSTNKGLNDYVLLESIEKELKPYFGISEPENGTSAKSEADRIEPTDISRPKQDIVTPNAFTEAHGTYLALYERLYFPNWKQLLVNDGDLFAWKMAHLTEEALITIKETTTVFKEAVVDYLSISSSTVDGRDELLEKLTRAIKNLSPNAKEYLKDFESENKLDSMREDIQKLHKVLENNETIPRYSISPTDEEQTNDRKKTENSQTDVEAFARATIRSVKCRLHQLHRDRLAGNLQARNNLILSTVASGLITYTLLFLAIITFPYTEDLPPFTSALASAVVLYVTGAAAGLFGRIYAEANKESAINDYGLSQASLKAIPLISGLAAIGGVLIINTTTFSLTKDSTFLLNIFTLNAGNMLVAITFGFAPNLLIRNFQKGEDRYVSNFESTRKK